MNTTDTDTRLAAVLAALRQKAERLARRGIEARPAEWKAAALWLSGRHIASTYRPTWSTLAHARRELWADVTIEPALPLPLTDEQARRVALLLVVLLVQDFDPRALGLSLPWSLDRGSWPLVDGRAAAQDVLWSDTLNGWYHEREAQCWLDLADAAASQLGIVMVDPVGPFVPTLHDLYVVEVLSKAKQTLDQIDIHTASGVPLRTVKDRLPALEEAGIVHRPHGPRSGYAITAAGLDLHEKAADK